MLLKAPGADEGVKGFDRRTCPASFPAMNAGRVHCFLFIFLPSSSAWEFGAKDIHMLDLRWLSQQIGCICHQGGSDRAG